MRPEIQKVVDSLTTDKWRFYEGEKFWHFVNNKNEMYIDINKYGGPVLLRFKGIIILDEYEDMALRSAAHKLIGLKDEPRYDSVMQEISEMEL